MSIEDVRVQGVAQGKETNNGTDGDSQWWGVE